MKVNFSNYFEALALKYRDCEAVVNVERDRRFTFGQLHLLTNQIVNMMHDTLSLGAGDRYFCILHNDNLSLLQLPTLFKGAATAVYSNILDSLDEHAWQIERVAPKVVFVETSFLKTHYDILRNSVDTVVCMDPLDEPLDGVLCFWDLIEDVPETNPDVALDDREHVALIRFTGGTTSRGKPVAYSIDNWFAIRDAFYALPEVDWNENTRTLHIAPLTHGTCAAFLPTFFMGGCNVTMNIPDLLRFAQVVAEERITTTMAVPTMLYRLVETPDLEQYDLSTLTTVIYGAAPMSAVKLKLLQKRLGNIFVQIYGGSESAAFGLTLNKSDHRIGTEAEEKRLASAGRRTSNAELLIVDGEGKPVTDGEIGEIWMRARSTVSGYYRDPEKTAEEFFDGFWKTGDMAWMDADGFVYLVDRKKDMIISGGFNVYAIEVEAAIDSHDAVLMSVVVGVPHEEWSEAVHAEVVLRQGASLDDSALIAHAKQRLGSYKVPKTIAFVDELPLSAAGKVLRRAVREKYWASQARKVN
jgi:acyl-CoA synthetase (AMP-forming)/AMP-acid ligase II